MHYRAIVDQFSLSTSLDALSATIFVGAFLLVAWLTARRAAFGLAALAIVQPLAFARDVLGTTITLPKVVLLGVILGLTVYASGARRLLGERAPRALGIALVAYIAAVALSAFGAGDRHATLREALKAFEFLLIFATAYCCYRLDPDERTAIRAIAFVTGAVALSALAQEILGASSVECIGRAIVPRIAGVLEGPNQLAGYLEIGIATLAVWGAPRRSRLIVPALLLAAAALVLTLSRAGIAATLVVLIVVGFAYGRGALERLAWPVVGLVLGGLGAGAWALAAHTPDVFRLSLRSSACAGGVGVRGELWRAAWYFFTRHPWLGIGAGNYELDLGRAGVFGVRTHANSWYLQSLAEGGIVLFAATLGMVATWIATFAHRLRGASPWQVAAFAATLAIGLHQIFDYLLFYPKVAGPLFILTGIAAATLARKRA